MTGFECCICTGYIADGAGFTVVNVKTYDALSLHRTCARTALLKVNVSSTLAKRTVKRRRARAVKAGYR